MKNIITLFNLLIISVLLISCDKEDQEILELYNNNPGYAIGTVTYSVETTRKITYYFEYYVSGTLYTGGKEIKNTDNAEELYEGSTYLVVYDINDPSISHLNTKYVIESEYQFDDMIKDFEQYPPEP